MGFADNYFIRHRFLLPQIKEPPPGLLRFCVVIPVYLEDRLEEVLYTLERTYKPSGDIEVILVFNCSAEENDSNRDIILQQYKKAQVWAAMHSRQGMKFYPLLIPDLPRKHAGAGLARKIGMDEALDRFNRLDTREGVILSLDADTLVDRDYFTGIENAMTGKPDTGGCILNFAHPVTGNEYEKEVYNAVIQYELHIRYYKHALEYTGFPWSNYTIGSCFGVKAEVYAKQGGMNRQKAGEDFYFLNKLFPHIQFINVTETSVYPSPRPSDRVPFGTGPVISKFLRDKIRFFLTYSPEAFDGLKILFGGVSEVYEAETAGIKRFLSGLSEPIREYLEINGFSEKIIEIRKNTSDLRAFQKRFFLWFDGFRVVKYLNFVHDGYYRKIPVQQAADELLNKLGYPTVPPDPATLLDFFRKLDQVKC
jgi:glycosyltransferase involved in cell wall biosynthesis